MGLIKKQTIKGSIYSYLGVLVGYVNMILIMPNLMSPEQIGLTQILVAVSALYAQFSTLGFNNVTNRLFPYFRNDKNGHNGFVFITVAVGMLGFTLSLFAFFFLKPIIIRQNIEDSPLLVEYIFFLIPLIFFRMFFLLLDNYNKVLYDATTGTFLSDLFYRLGNLFLLGAYFMKWIDFSDYVSGYVFFLSFPAVYLAVLILIRKQFNLKPQLAFVTPKLRNEMVSLSVYGIIGGLSGVAVMSIDKIMINQFFDLAYTGIYSVSFFFGTIILIPNRALSKISSTFIAEAWKTNDIATINDIYYKSSINQFILGMLLTIGILVNMHNIFQILPPEYEQGKWVMVFISVANLITVSTGVSIMILATSKKYKVHTYIMASLIVLTVITNLICIPIWGITGAAIASMIAIFLNSFIRVGYMYFRMQLFPYRKSHLFFLAISAITLLVGFIIPVFKNYIIDILIRSSLVTLVFVTGIYFLRVSEEVNKIINQILSRAGIKF